MKKRLLPFLLFTTGAALACSDAGGVDADAIPAGEITAVRMALDSAFLHDSTLDSAFTGPNGLYASMSALVLPFVDRATRIAQGADTTRVVGIEFDVDATRGGDTLKIDMTGVLAWKGYQPTSRTMDSVYFLLGAGRAPINDSLWARFTLDTAGSGTGFVIHQAPDSSTTTWLSRGGHLHTTSSTYGSGQQIASITVARGTLNGAYTMSAKSVPDSSTTVSAGLDFGNGAHAIKVTIRGVVP
jgi:hypothetical protein